MKFFLRGLLFLALLVLLIFAGIRINYHLISYSVSDQVYRSADDIPFREYTLILGAGDYEPEQWVNPAFNHRMESARTLYKSGKTSRFIVSGIRKDSSYDEPAEMKAFLVQAGVPEQNIISDSLGTRTWESVRRIRENFHLNRIIILTQPGHIDRALFSAGCIKLDAIGFEAPITPQYIAYWTHRERLARVKCVLDCIAYKFKI